MIPSRRPRGFSKSHARRRAGGRAGGPGEEKTRKKIGREKGKMTAPNSRFVPWERVGEVVRRGEGMEEKTGRGGGGG